MSSRIRLFEFDGYFRHGFQEAKQEAALHRVTHISVQRTTRG